MSNDYKENFKLAEGKLIIVKSDDINIEEELCNFLDSIPSSVDIRCYEKDVLSGIRDKYPDRNVHSPMEVVTITEEELISISQKVDACAIICTTDIKELVERALRDFEGMGIYAFIVVEGIGIGDVLTKLKEGYDFGNEKILEDLNIMFKGKVFSVKECLEKEFEYVE